MDSAKETIAPKESNLDVCTISEPCIGPYREVVGLLMYQMVGSRPDIAFSVCNLAKFVEKPRMVYWLSLKRVIRYLIQSKHFSLVYGEENSDILLLFFTDADWAGNKKTRTSTNNCVVMIGGAAITWYYSQQEVVALSSKSRSTFHFAPKRNKLSVFADYLTDFSGRPRMRFRNSYIWRIRE